MDEETKKNYEGIVSNRFSQFFQILEKNLDFEHWGFQQSFYGIAEYFPPSVIYDSDSCRVRFLWYEPDPRETPTVLVRYGRLHAPINQRYMIWNGRQHYCWHDPHMAFHFLDGLPPNVAVNNRHKWPSTLEKVNQSLVKEKISTPEWAVKMHAASWDYFGGRLFDLFDIRRSEIWEQYTIFLKNCYGFDGRSDEYGYRLEYEIC